MSSLAKIIFRFVWLLLVLFGALNSSIAAPIGSYNISALPGSSVIQETIIKVTAKAKDGTTFSDEFTFGAGTMPDSARDTIKQALTSAGWDVTNSGSQGINITGHGGSPITEVNGGQQVPNDKGLGNLAISEDGSSGVKRGQATVGEDYKFSFSS